MKHIFTSIGPRKIIVSAVLIGILGAGASEVRFTGADFVQNEIIIQYKDPNTSISETQSGIIQDEDFITSGVSRVILESGQTLSSVLNTLNQDPNVQSAQPNFIYSSYTLDPLMGSLWGLENIGQLVNGVSGTSGADIKWNQAMTITSGASSGTGGIIAIIDDGISYTHGDLSNKMRDGNTCKDENNQSLGGCNNGYDFVDQDKDPLPSGSDTHGTHIAGIIGAEGNNGVGVVGVNPNARLMALKVGTNGQLTTANIIKAINFAKYNGASVINASWGATDTSCSNLFDAMLYETIKNFPGLFVTAAGNSNTNHNGSTFFGMPSDYASTLTGCWTGLDNIISVGASDQSDNKASFSEFGNSIHIMAPGTNILSTITAGLAYGFQNGTSMATPHVAALAALIRGYRPDLTYQQVKNMILEGADSIASLSSYISGGKRLNAYRSLALLTNPKVASLHTYTNTDKTSEILSGGTTTGISSVYIERNPPTDQGVINGYSYSVVLSGNELESGWTNSTGVTISTLTGEGVVIVSVTGVNDVGISGDAKIISFVIDNTAPTLNVSTLSGTQIASGYATLTGTLEDNIGSSGVVANDIHGSGKNIWEATIPLTGGENNITITGFDNANNSTSTILNIIRIPLTIFSNIGSQITDKVSILFETDLSTSGQIDYGTSSNVFNFSQNDSFYGTSHTINLSGLDLNSEYYYQIQTNAMGYSGPVSNSGNFKTPDGITTYSVTDSGSYTGNVWVVDGNATGIQFNSTGIIYISSESGGNSITIGTENLSINSSNSSWNGLLSAPRVTTTTGNILDTGYTQIPALKITIPNIDTGTLFSGQSITLKINVGSTYNSVNLRVYKSLDNGATFQQFTTCTVSNNICTFVVNQGAYFAFGYPSDTVPDQFTFVSVTSAELNSEYISAPITIQGLNFISPISVVGGYYSKNNGAYTNLAGTVNNGDTVKVKLISSQGYNTLKSTTLTIGGMRNSYNVTTKSAPVIQPPAAPPAPVSSPGQSSSPTPPPVIPQTPISTGINIQAKSGSLIKTPVITTTSIKTGDGEITFKYKIMQINNNTVVYKLPIFKDTNMENILTTLIQTISEYFKDIRDKNKLFDGVAAVNSLMYNLFYHIENKKIIPSPYHDEMIKAAGKLMEVVK